MTFNLNREDRRIVVKIVAIYSLFGGLWIYLSDSALGLLVRDPDIITRIATYKGLFFIAITAALLYYLIGRYIYRLSESSRQIVANEMELRSLLELMPVGVAWSDNIGVIKYINHTFIELFGYALADVPTVDEWFIKAYPEPGYRQEVISLWMDNISEYHTNGTPPPPLDVKVTNNNGSVRRVIINTQMSKNRTLVIFTDITERENQQEELIKKQKLESIGVLAGGIAHDFNNILTAILGNISFAEMFIGPNHKAEVPLLQAEKAAKRAAELAHQLLTFAKGGQPVTTSVAPRLLIEEAISLVLRGSNAQSCVEIAEDVNNIEADAGQISQAFNNLIINALQAMPGGGTITIQAANASFSGINNPKGIPPGEYVKFVFTDEGCGIPAENLANIFDPYFTTKSSGSGLGLASVQSIISKHGGHISVTSSIGKGTAFEILLPAGKISVSDEQALPDDAAIRSDTGSGVSLLVMDDEEMIRELTAAILEELGYRVTTCKNGEQAVALYKAAFDSGEPFSAVILDLTIPGGMGGQETANAILDIDPLAKMIVSSGYSNDPIMSEFRKYGFAAAVSKPYGVKAIAEVLEKLFKSGIKFSPYDKNDADYSSS